MARPIYERQKRESAKVYRAFWTYVELGEDRSHAAVAEKLGQHVSQIHRWSSMWTWVTRAEAYDDFQHQERRRQRAKIQASEAFEQAKSDAAFQKTVRAACDQMLARVVECMNLPPVQHSTKDGKTTYTPAKWTYRDISKILQTAIDARNAVTPKDAQSEIHEERFEHEDFKPEDE